MPHTDSMEYRSRENLSGRTGGCMLAIFTVFERVRAATDSSPYSCMCQTGMRPGPHRHRMAPEFRENLSRNVLWFCQISMPENLVATHIPKLSAAPRRRHSD